MFQLPLVRDEDVAPLADGVGNVLEKVGVLCENTELLRLLKTAGAKVDFQAERAWFPKRMVREFVDDIRKEGGRQVELALYGTGTSEKGARKKTAALPPYPRFRPPGLPTFGTQIAQLYYDYERSERRAGNRADLISLVKLADVLHPEIPAGHALVQAETPPLLEALESALVLAEYAHKPGAAFAWYVDQVDYLKEMGEILGLKDWFAWGSVCFAHPLRFDKTVADKFVRRVREGVPTGITAMPIAGFTTPVTVEGFIVVSSAEHVAAWIAARAVNPKVALGGSMWAGSVDMRTGAVSYCAPDSMYYAFAAVEFLRRWTGIRLPVGGGEYCDAREPGLYAAMEKAYKAMLIAAFSGQHPEIGEGLLEEGKTISPVQLMVERDITLGVTQFGRALDPTAERIALPSIVAVDLGLTTNHMISDHTLQHFRQELWLPQFVDRSGWTGACGDRAMLDRAQARINELVAQYRKPEGRDDQLAQMRKVVARARKKLVG